MAEAVPDTR